jgi:hypothetical protein
MKPILVIATIIFIAFGCASNKSATLNPDTYGYTEANPISTGDGPSGERAYLNRLTGPNGEKIQYSRIGSCCPFKTKNGLLDNTGMLDKYEVTYEGLGRKIILYLNMYDKGEMVAPKGFVLLTQ